VPRPRIGNVTKAPALTPRPGMDRQAVAEFARQTAASRREIFAIPATYEGRALCVSHSAVRSHRDIAAAGFENMPDFLGRVDMAAYPWFTPLCGKNILIDGRAYKIGEIAKITLGGEWWFSLKKP
jgi:hypothetical protein